MSGVDGGDSGVVGIEPDMDAFSDMMTRVEDLPVQLGACGRRSGYRVVEELTASNAIGHKKRTVGGLDDEGSREP